MKNWQNYATNADTNQSQLSPVRPKAQNQNPSQSPSQHNSPSHPKSAKPKAWYVINIILASLCALALIFGIDHANAEHSGFIGIIHATALTFYLPPLFITALLTGDNIYGNSTSGTILHWAYIIISLLLIANFVLAFVAYRKHHQSDNRRWRNNLIFASIPAILALLATLIAIL